MMMMMMMGTHIARLVTIFSLMSLTIVSFGDKGSENLLKFKDSLGDSSPLSNWNASTSPCKRNKANWIGVICVKDKIWGLQLENMGLQGSVNIEILQKLRTLRIISLMNNNLEGKMPNVRKLDALKALYLSNNRFSGEIPDDAFQGMRSLNRVLLANNGFTGKIPSSLTILPKLWILRLEGNQFYGRIPNFKPKLKMVSFANNELEGPIPASLSHMSATMFSGNKNLCGKPLEACNSSGPSPSPSPNLQIVSSPPRKKGRRSRSHHVMIFAYVLISAVLLLLITATFVLFLSRKHLLLGTNKVDDSNKSSTNDEKEKKVLKTFETGNLIFLKDDKELRFGLQDLLRASAEVLGSGNFGASYKVVMMNDEGVVVKRYKQMNNDGKEYFYEHMRTLGRLNHQNLQPLMAYHYMKEEKLLVSKYMDNGSLASHLHGNQCGLNWQIRLKIIKGVARGLIYLYNELPSLILPHGNLKSSNVLLDESFNPLLCDYAFAPMINQEEVHMFMAAYRSPEYALKGRISKKTDVWCLGILILEVLTGKFPENYLHPIYDKDASLATWVKEMVSQVLDTQLLRGSKHNKDIEMINLLKIGLSCCEEDLNTRPDLKEVVQEIEKLEDEDEEDDKEFSSTIREVNAER